MYLNLSTSILLYDGITDRQKKTVKTSSTSNELAFI